MKILFFSYATIQVASSRIRVYQYLPYFKRSGIHYKVINNYTYLPYYFANCNMYSKYFSRENLIYKGFLSVRQLLVYAGKGFNLLFSWFQTLRLIFYAALFSYEVIYIQKVVLPYLAVKVLKLLKKRLVFDFDDAIYTRKHIFKLQKRFDRLVPLYDLVVVVNYHAEKYIHSRGNSNTLVITGPIDINRYSVRKTPRRDRIVVGWVGSFSTQKYLASLKGVFERLCDKYSNFYIVTIGAGPIELGSTRVIQKKWSLETEVEDLHEFDIGIMPLEDNEWSRGKGGYKLLQYMAIGIPCCASPVGINRSLVDDGVNGFLAENEEEWLKKLSILIEDQKLRKAMGEKGRRKAEQRYSFESYYPKLLSRLSQLC